MAAEASILLETVLHKYYEADVIAALLVFPTRLWLTSRKAAPRQLSRSQSRLALNASVERDGKMEDNTSGGTGCRRQVKLSLGGVVARCCT